jgi:murein DD-endopeptidase MepM/ murein hydrolase activator NlpD
VIPIGLMVVSLLPVTGVITQDYSTHHPAIDISCIPGSPVIATHDGHLSSSYSYNLGNVATVMSDTLVSTYSHLQTVNTAGIVMAGDQIGTCGSTGQYSTGPHVHFTLHDR